MLGIFREEGNKAKKIHLKQKAEKEAEEKKRLEAKKRKEEEKRKAETASVVEVSNEEADRLQKEIDAQK